MNFVSLSFNLFWRKLFLFLFLPFMLALCTFFLFTNDQAPCSQQLIVVLVSLQPCCREVTISDVVLQVCCTVKIGWQPSAPVSLLICMTAGRARLLTLLKPSQGGLLWRTAKADVAHELGLPPQHQHTSSLQFSAIERHFYSRQHAECSLRASSTISSQLLSQAAQGLAGQRRLTAAEEKKLLFPLLRLRQACCHPQVACCLLSPWLWHDLGCNLFTTLCLSILIAKSIHYTSVTLI